MDRGLDLARILARSCEQLAGALANLRRFSDLERSRIEIHRLENEGDRTDDRGDRGQAVIAMDRRETPLERADRHLVEMLQELRVALPGVQVLFAFLLIVPFSERFKELNAGQQKIYYATLLCTALATALLITPTAYHRILFRLREKEYLVKVTNRFAIAGLGALALAMTGVILLISDFLFGTATTVAATVGAGLTFGLIWYVLPLARRLRRGAQR